MAPHIRLFAPLSNVEGVVLFPLGEMGREAVPLIGFELDERG